MRVPVVSRSMAASCWMDAASVTLTSMEPVTKLPELAIRFAAVSEIPAEE